MTTHTSWCTHHHHERDLDGSYLGWCEYRTEADLQGRYLILDNSDRVTVELGRWNENVTLTLGIDDARTLAEQLRDVLARAD